MQITVWSKELPGISTYLIGLACSEGVLAFAISPADQKIDLQTKEIISSIKLLKQPLDAQIFAKESELQRAHSKK